MSASKSETPSPAKVRQRPSAKSLANLRPVRPGEIRNPQGRNGTELFRPAIGRRVRPKDADVMIDEVKNAASGKGTRLADRVRALEFLRDTHDGKLRDVKVTTATEVQTESGPQRVIMQLEYRD